MATYNVHAGHNKKAPGASGCFNEVTEDRKVKNLVIKKLTKLGHTVYDCTDDAGTTKNAVLKNIVAKCNKHKVDLDISIHFNAFNKKASGTEVLCYNSKTHDVAKRIVKEIVALGFVNRGVKDGSHLYVLKNTNCPAILIECCFCDCETDKKLYNAEKMATAIVKGITGKTVKTSTTKTSVVEKKEESKPKQLYRVRKSWSNVSSQLGAYEELDNAKKNCPAGYNVYDNDGNAIYKKAAATTNPQVNADIYRVRKSWNDANSQIGAYKELDNAKKNCPAGYTVYDNMGKSVFAPKEEVTNTVKDIPEIPPAPKAVDVSPLKGISHDAYIEYIGAIAKEDMKRTGVLASVTIAQSILESSWGQSELSLKAHNLFGMKCSLSGNNWGSLWDGKKYAVRSNEEKNGVMKKVLSDFRSYSNIKESILDHSMYLTNAKNGSKKRYEGIKEEKDYRKAITIIKNGGYATDSKYVDKVCNIIEQYDLTVFDTDSDPVNKEYKIVISPEEISKMKKSVKDNANNAGVLSGVANKLLGLFK